MPATDDAAFWAWWREFTKAKRFVLPIDAWRAAVAWAREQGKVGNG